MIISTGRPAMFNHNNTAFPLDGKHKNVACAKVSSTGNYRSSYIYPVQTKKLHMRVLSLAGSLLILILLLAGRRQDSPHGSDFKISCSVCHSAKGWELDKEIYSFDHNTTRLPLEGQHNPFNCKACHPTLVFAEAETECFSCHTDMHNQTVGMDCARCHTPRSWIVENITDVHRQSRFPFRVRILPPSASIAIHRPPCFNLNLWAWSAWIATCRNTSQPSNPNHVLGNFSTECIDCHFMTAFSWTGSGFNHSFFPLTLGHAIFDCNLCHTGTDYSSTSAECFSCHQEDFNATTNPNHLASDLSTDCMECHTTMPGWKPAQFDHSFFSLTFGHAITDCNLCHVPGNYSNVSTECFSCHETDYNATTNPNHLSAGIDNVCMECHTTMPGWKPAEFRAFKFPSDPGSCHYVTATSVMTRPTIPMCRPIVSPAMRPITMPPPIPITSPQELTTSVWSVTPPCPDGNLPILITPASP